MKISTVLTILSICIATILQAQTPQFKYQGVARNVDNSPISLSDINLRFNILQGSNSGQSIYEETQLVTTNDLGLFSLNIGSADLLSVDWSAGSFFLQVEMDPNGGTDYQLMGTSQLLSVPFSFFAEKAGNISEAIQTLSIDSTTQELVLSQGGRVPLNALGNGGSDADIDPQNELQTLSWNGTTQEISISNGNSVAIPLQGGPSSTFIQDGDADTRISLDNGNDSDVISLNVEGENILNIGLNNWNLPIISVPGAHKNTFLGLGAGQNTQYDPTVTPDGKFNTFIGNNAGLFNRAGHSNTGVGFRAGGNLQNTRFNSCFGTNAGAKINEGELNVFIGSGAGAELGKGSRNTFVGHGSGTGLGEVDDNVLIGFNAGHNGGELGFNILIGTNAGLANRDGTGNIFLGHNSGHSSRNGSNNIFIGHNSGSSQQISNTLIIDNDASTSPLIFGKLDENYVRINGDLGFQVKHGNALNSDGFLIESINTDTASWRMHVDNSTGELKLFSTQFSAANGLDKNVASINPMTGEFSSISDQRYKTNFEPLINSLNRLMSLEAFKYNFEGQQESEEKTIGFLAQRLEEVFPEVVKYSKGNDLYHVNYNALSVVAIQAIQEQNKIIEYQETKLENLESKVNELESLVHKLLEARK